MRTDTWRRASQTLPPSMYVSNICLTNLPLKSGAGSEATAAAKLTVARAHVQAQRSVTTPCHPFSKSTFNR